MAKQLIIPIIITLVSAMAVSSCNSDPVPQETAEEKSVQVKKFNLAEDNQVLDSLENVFFSIDLQNAKIFNADSLPYGTKVDKLIPEITVVSSASLVEIQIPRPNKTDTVYDYNEHSTDSVDFSNGPVHLRVVSQGSLVERTYEIKVNVHQVKPDTIAWMSIESAPLPTSFGSIDGQKVVEMDAKYYCLTSSAGKYCLSVTDDLYASAWETEEISLPFDADVASLAVAGSRFYMLDADGRLRSADASMSSWEDTGLTWHGIYGAYGTELIGCSEANGTWAIEMYPSGSKTQMPDGFPVEGASAPHVYDTTMGFAPQLMMLGGRDASGRYVSGSWAYDGQQWAMISHRPLPQGIEGMCLVAYDLFDVPNTTWRPVKYPALLAFGGIGEDGVNRTVYTSSDWGLTWRKGSELIQLPAGLEVCAGSSAIVYATTMHTARHAGEWTPIEVRGLHPQCVPVPWTQAASRVEKPITEWECPAIYVYGGRDAQGRQSTKAWRGQLLRYTFLPKY